MSQAVLGGVYSELAADPDLADLVEMFVAEIPERINKLIEAYDASDWEGLRRIAHQMKGAAGSYGFNVVTPIASRLERYVSEPAREEEIRETLERLVETCRQIRAGTPNDQY